MLALKNVEKRYGGVYALRDFSLIAPGRKTTALIGPSGCGKSTVLRLLAGLISPDRGSIEIEGKPWTPETRHRLGYVIQEGGLFPHLTARQNVALQARYLGWKNERLAERISELSSLVHIPGELLERYPGQLSGGQRQRVSLMRALMLDPVTLLLDEPLGALDPIIRRELQDELRETFRRLGKTVILVTHDFEEAAYLSDYLVLMRAGEIVQQGEPPRFVQSPASDYVTRFVNAHRSRAEAFGK